MTTQAINTASESSVGPDRSTPGGKYLIFTLAGEEYGLEILKVREIIRVMPTTAVPQMPEFVKGVVNLRGRIIPVVDLRLRFGMAETEYDDETCIVVVNVGSEMGVIVDAVQEVLDIDEGQIEPSPDVGQDVETEFILGMGKIGDRVKILLDVDKVLAFEDRNPIRETAET